MLIIIPIFNHYNWVFKVARSQISSLYVTRSWGVKLCRQMPMQLWSPAKQLRKTKTWAAVHHLFDLTPVCRVRAHSWGHCSLVQIPRVNVCRNRSKLVWSSQETVRKQKSQQMETINTQKERLVLTRIYRTLSQSKPWSHTQPERQCSAGAQQPLFFSVGCGDAFRHMTPVLPPHGVQCVSMVQKWQKQQTEVQKSFRAFLSSPSSLLKDTGDTDTLCTATTKGHCGSTQMMEWPYFRKCGPEVSDSLVPLIYSSFSITQMNPKEIKWTEIKMEKVAEKWRK